MNQISHLSTLFLRGFDPRRINTPFALGIDPDSHGSLCAVTTRGELIGCLRFHRRYKKEDRYLLRQPEGLCLLQDILHAWLLKSKVIAVERVGAMPGDGRSSLFKFATTLGQLLGFVQSTMAYQRASFEKLCFVHPRTWQACFSLRGNAKSNTRDAAKKMWPEFDWPTKNGAPDTKITDGAFIAAWAAQNRAHTCT